MKSLLLRPAVAAVLTGLATFLVYCRTVAPGVTFIDSGELATVACTLGIAHPTGYPLFTLLGRLFSLLPVAGEAIARLNLMAALMCSGAAALLVLGFRRVLLSSLRDASGTAFALPAACGGVLLLAFSPTYWSQALEVEVYPLHLLFVALLLLVFFRANHPLPGSPRAGRDWMLFAYLVGLSFTNHMTTILLAPGLLYLYFARNGFAPASLRRLRGMALPFLAGLSVYLYLPLRASRAPVPDWGNIVSLERFLWHVSGKQYRVWMFSSTEVMGKQLTYFLTNLPGEFGAAGLLVALGGFVLLWRENRRVAVGAALLACTCVAYAINYDIHDIDSYFLLAYVSIALAAAAGLAGAAGLLARRIPGARRAAPVLLVALGILPLVAHMERVDESGDHLVEDYTRNMFSSLRPGAVVLSYQWDFWVSASYYVQMVGNLRPDVTVIDKELLRRSWYLKELGRRYPWLIAASRPEVDAFLAQVDLFEHGLPYDPAQIQARYVGMIESFIRRSLPAHPVYVTPEIEPEFTRGLDRVPEGLALRLSPVEGDVPAPFPPVRYRPLERSGRLEDTIRRLYSDALLARGEYFLLRLRDPGEAEKCLEMAGFYEPGSPRARRLASMIQR